MSTNIRPWDFASIVLSTLAADLGPNAHIYFRVDGWFTIVPGRSIIEKAYRKGRTKSLIYTKNREDCDNFTKAMDDDLQWLNHLLQRRPDPPEYQYTACKIVDGNHAYNVVLSESPDGLEVLRVDGVSAYKWGPDKLIKPWTSRNRKILQVTVF